MQIEINRKIAKQNYPLVSVIVPTFRDWGRLRLCLNALERQTYPRDHYEVIVVNNDPEDPSPSLKWPGFCTVIQERKPGSYRARNAGVNKSKGTVLAFTDSDCIPDRFWIESMVATLKNGTDRVGGKIEVFPRSKRWTLAEIYDKAFAFPQKKLTSQGVAVTANMAVRRTVFETIGPFNEALLSGGDIEWGHRAQARGFAIEYCQYAIVKHPARRSVRDLLKKRKRVVEGRVQIIGKVEKKAMLKLALNVLWPPIKSFSDLAKRDKLSFYEKIAAGGVFYLLRAYTNVLFLRLQIHLYLS